MNRLSLIGSLLAALSSTVVADVEFSQVRSILSENCFQCHGPDAEHREADLRLDVKQNVFGKRDDHTIVVPQNPQDSELFLRVSTDDPDRIMPPPDSGKTLTQSQIKLLERWIRQGAKWSQHWSFIPPVRPDLPSTKNKGWMRNEIDYFILARLNELELSTEKEADRRALIRRLFLDLTGLPPSREQVHDFLSDTHQDAYERLVDRLLASRHFGERMTVAWLDQARYSDTNGYSIDGGRHMWLWRDWIIHAYNSNMPFDQFLVEQLAGDLLPNATLDQIVATGFNRNHMITHEGGTIPAENLVNYAADRVRTTSEVFLGLTMGCAQCHDHKYDPLTQRDYYQFFAFFNTLDDRGLDGNSGVNSSPKIKATSILARNTNEMEELKAELVHLKERLKKPLMTQSKWEQNAKQQLASLGKNLKLLPLEVIKVTSPNRGSAYDVRDDGTVFIPDASGRSPSISARLDVDHVTGLRILFEPDDKFPEKGLGHGRRAGLKGSFVLTSFSVSATTVESDQVDLFKMVAIAEATASASHPDYPPQDSLDERDVNGWSPGSNIKTAQHITFQFGESIHASETPFVTVMLVWGAGHSLIGGKYRIFAVTGNDDGTNIPADIQTILNTDTADRSESQRERLRAYHTSIAPDLANVRHQIHNLTERIEYLSKPHEVMVMNVADKPRQTFILNRGQYDQPGEAVSAATPSSLPRLPEGAPANRLGLAKWLVQPGHPLTARVAVNRIWQMFFGTGIVSTAADFGSQGQRPSHPKLLDWLAVEFVESGWNVKELVKKIVMSAAYRQRSVITEQKLAVDPSNRYLSRGPRFRLHAEFIRDNLLCISGLLVDRIGGPSVKPYQPENLWREVSHYGSTPATAQVFVQHHGERLYRRSMYTYWKRTLPPPSMSSFDAPNREVCTINRSNTNTPLQALVLLNDPQFVEASRAFAERIIKSNTNREDRIRFAYETALARLPDRRELEIIGKTFDRELERYRQNPKAADRFLKIGESLPDPSINSAEHAAWATVARLILNLSATITKS